MWKSLGCGAANVSVDPSDHRGHSFHAATGNVERPPSVQAATARATAEDESSWLRFSRDSPDPGVGGKVLSF